eukprot:1156184-Pelagomonas_calceolata.AAC.2
MASMDFSCPSMSPWRHINGPAGLTGHSHKGGAARFGCCGGVKDHLAATEFVFPFIVCLIGLRVTPSTERKAPLNSGRRRMMWAAGGMGRSSRQSHTARQASRDGTSGTLNATGIQNQGPRSPRHGTGMPRMSIAGDIQLLRSHGGDAGTPPGATAASTARTADATNGGDSGGSSGEGGGGDLEGAAPQVPSAVQGHKRTSIAGAAGQQLHGHAEAGPSDPEAGYSSLSFPLLPQQPHLTAAPADSHPSTAASNPDAADPDLADTNRGQGERPLKTCSSKVASACGTEETSRNGRHRLAAPQKLRLAPLEVTTPPLADEHVTGCKGGSRILLWPFLWVACSTWQAALLGAHGLLIYLDCASAAGAGAAGCAGEKADAQQVHGGDASKRMSFDAFGVWLRSGAEKVGKKLMRGGRACALARESAYGNF